MILASLLTEDIYRHENALKHINIVNSDDFSALFAVNTPIVDNSGVAHAVEHMLFRRSAAFPKPETLFQLTSLTDAKINASTLADITYFHCQSQCSHTFLLAISYLLNGLFNPVFNADDLQYEIHDGNDKGVIFQELLAAEHADNKESEITKKNDNNAFCYGGISTSIGELSLNDLTVFYQDYYQASNITLVTANADIEQIANLIALLPKQPKKIKLAEDKHRQRSQANMQKNAQENKNNEHHQKKYSQALSKLITLYQLWLQYPYYQEIDNYKEIKGTNKSLLTDASPLLPQSNLITSLVTLSTKLEKNTIDDKTIRKDIKNADIKQSANKSLLPNLFSELCQQAKKNLAHYKLPKNELTTNKNDFQKNLVCVNDHRNALWLMDIGDSEQTIASITSYLISAYPIFLAPRCQGLCYAIQALTIENSAYLAIYSAFDVNPNMRLKEVASCLLKLSQDDSFINASLALAKIKYCRVYQIHCSQVTNITATDISTYLLRITFTFHPKV